MYDLSNKKVAVIGQDAGAAAACQLLAQAGAEIFAVAEEDGASQNQTSAAQSGVTRLVSEGQLPDGLEFVVHTAGLSRRSPLIQRLLARGFVVISDAELASRGFYCLSVAITGTNGKTTTAELVAQMLASAQRKTLRAGASGAPVCSVTEASRELDFLTLDLNSFQVESLDLFRPAVAVITNIRPDDEYTYGGMGEYARSLSKIFQNQQVFDWAIIQSEALAHLRALNLPIRSKIITFSANNRRADIFMDRGLLISAMEGWSGPLFNMEQSVLSGPHHAENIMAALAVGRVLRIKLEEMAEAVKNYRPGPHRSELVAEHEGVTFINNSKALNVDAVAQSIEALPPGRGGEPNIWLIAGGKDKGLNYHDLGPLLARRVKGVFLIGETAEKLRAAWSLFTPCTVVHSLLEAVSNAAEKAVAGDVVLLSPACSSRDMFQNYQHRGEAFRAAVAQVLKTGVPKPKILTS